MALARRLEVLQGRNKLDCFNSMSKVELITALDPTYVAPAPAAGKGQGKGQGKGRRGRGAKGGKAGRGAGAVAAAAGGAGAAGAADAGWVVAGVDEVPAGEAEAER